jgi:hypothetical protein
MVEKIVSLSHWSPDDNQYLYEVKYQH